MNFVFINSTSHFFQNGGVCVDGVNDYSCKCPGEFGGKFCEVAPMVALMYPQTSPCQHHECRNGICLTPPGAQDYICRCSPGYSGKRCEYLTTISFLHNASFAELEPLRTKPEANITMVSSYRYIHVCHGFCCQFSSYFFSCKPHQYGGVTGKSKNVGVLYRCFFIFKLLY